MEIYPFYVVLFCKKWKVVSSKHWDSIKTLPKFGIKAVSLKQALAVNAGLGNATRESLAHLNRKNRVA